MKKLMKKLGIFLPVQYVNGTGEYHYYDHINNVIVLDLNAKDVSINSIIHEFVHHLQWTNGYRKLMVKELEKSYDKRTFEYHAEAVCMNYKTFLRQDGRLNIEEILSYYDDIVAYFYE